MKITIFGVGYVGLVTGVCFADLGHEVLCVDIDQDKISLLKRGKSPVYENGMDELLRRNIEEKRLSFTLDGNRAVLNRDYIFIAVGTPAAQDGSADLGHVFEVAEIIGANLSQYTVIVNKSTAPVGTLEKIRFIIERALQRRGVTIDFDEVSNPEFLKQGDAISDFRYSDRVVIGADNTRAFNKMYALYESFAVDNILSMDIRSAELTKYAANAFLAARISFMNDIALLAEKLHADVENVRCGISSDPRVGRYFLHAGCGYGGSCFPKDVKALCKMAEENGFRGELFRAIENVNERQKKKLFEKIKKHFAGNLKNKTFALWGLSFKPHTDDMRNAPSRTILELLWQSGAIVQAYDPVAMFTAERIYGKREDFLLCSDLYKALEAADALAIVTEWPEFQNPDFSLVKKKLKNSVIFDGRNIFDPKKMKKLAIDYYSIGRN